MGEKYRHEVARHVEDLALAILEDVARITKGGI